MPWNSALKRALSSLRERRRRARRTAGVQRQPEERSDPHQLQRKARRGEHRLQQPLELRAALLQSLPAGLALEQCERGHAGRHRHGIAGQRTGLVRVAVGRQARHDPPRTAERADRHAATDHLAEGGEIGVDPEPLGRAAAA